MRVMVTIRFCTAEEDLQPILHEEVEIAVAALKKGKSAGVDNVPEDFFKQEGRPRYFDKDL